MGLFLGEGASFVGITEHGCLTLSQMRPLIFLFLARNIFAQELLSLDEAVSLAVSKYPSIQVSTEQISAASASVALARTAFLPRADLLLQANRATHNNVFGMLMPNAVIPPISGPVIDASKFRNVFGTAAGVLVSWEPYDFGLRQSGVDAATASKRRASLSLERTKFEVAAATADAYLTILAARKNIDSANAAIERTKQLGTIVGALTKAELRPGADLSRVTAEQTVAEVFLFQARQSEQVARAVLTQMTGRSMAQVDLVAAKFDQLPPDQTAPPVTANHPALVEQEAAIEEVKARQFVLDRSLYPKFNAQAALYGRGTGASVVGPDQGWASGLGPNTGNWAMGFSMTWAALEFKTQRVKKEIEAANERKEIARRSLMAVEVNGAMEKAQAMITGSRQIAAITPQQVAAVKVTLEQVTARYRAGLGTLLEVADAQRMLAQAEVDDAMARLNVWRAQLSLAIAAGDLQPFLSLVK